MGPLADQEDEHPALSGQNTWAFPGGDSPTTSPKTTNNTTMTKRRCVAVRRKMTGGKRPRVWGCSSRCKRFVAWVWHSVAFLKQHASCAIQQFACIYDILWYTGYNVRMTYMWGIDCNTCFTNIVLWVLWFVCMNRDMFCIGDMYVTNKSIFVIICWNDFLRLRGIDMNWWCHIY